MSDTFDHGALRIFRYIDGTFGFGNSRPFTKADIATLASFTSCRSGTEQGLRDARQDILSALELVPKED